jgi:hypothetical protein
MHLHITCMLIATCIVDCSLLVFFRCSLRCRLTVGCVSPEQNHSLPQMITVKKMTVARPVPQRLQPPLSVLTNILSYIEHETNNYDGVCGVNKQWLIASQSVPNTTVRWIIQDKRARDDSFVLAIKKYPHVTSFIDFPSDHLISLLSRKSFDVLSLRSLSLIDLTNNLDGCGAALDMLTTRLSSSLSSLESLKFDCKGLSASTLIGLYKSASKLLQQFNPSASSENPKKSTSPMIRLNGELPQRCQSVLDTVNHGWTWSLLCSSCPNSYGICCGAEPLRTCPGDRCGKIMVILSYTCLCVG